MSFTDADHIYMARALRLAEQGRFFARPNPKVGCVITRDGEIVGEGAHMLYGQAHAEINALSQAGAAARGATAYVTLEPCAHQGKTGPCADALIAAGVSKVIAAMSDPNPSVNGGGLQRLKEAGIDVASGLMAESAAALNPGFLKRMRTGRPRVTVKLAVSVDGKTGMSSGESQWITGPEARLDVQYLRAEQDAIITGLGTLKHDDPSLTVRMDEWPEYASKQPKDAFRQPIRVLLDRKRQASLDTKLFTISHPVWWVGSEPATKQRLPKHVTALTFDNRTMLLDLLTHCAANQCNNVLVEAGATLAGAMIAAGLVDRLIIYQAPILLGSDARALASLSLQSMSEQVPLELTDLRHVGRDIRFTYSFNKLSAD